MHTNHSRKATGPAKSSATKAATSTALGSPRQSAPIVLASGTGPAKGNVVTTVDFYGTTLDVLGVESESKVRHFVAIRPISEALDVAHNSQWTKLHGQPWATVMEIITVGADGKSRTMSCLNLEALPMWLCSIKAGKVKPEARETLVRFQCECAAILYRAIFERPTVEVPVLAANDNSVEARLALLERRLGDLALGNRLESGAIGPRKAKVWIMGPLMHYARIMAPLLGQSIQSVRLEADKLVRKNVGFPLALGWAWEVLPESKLGDVTAEIASLTARAGKQFKRACAVKAMASHQLTIDEASAPDTVARKPARRRRAA